MWSGDGAVLISAILLKSGVLIFFLQYTSDYACKINSNVVQQILLSINVSLIYLP